jgi:hypothetical protein
LLLFPTLEADERSGVIVSTASGAGGRAGVVRPAVEAHERLGVIRHAVEAHEWLGVIGSNTSEAKKESGVRGANVIGSNASKVRKKDPGFIVSITSEAVYGDSMLSISTPEGNHGSIAPEDRSVAHWENGGYFSKELGGPSTELVSSVEPVVMVSEQVKAGSSSFGI